jgi:uroporphyrin-3 C-methyltransferase
MMLEQAQVALLREEQIIYRQSLLKVQNYLDRFFQYNSSVQTLESRITALAALQIEQQLPAINRSVEVLEALLIARQQRLTDADKPAGESIEDSQAKQKGELEMESVE